MSHMILPKTSLLILNYNGKEDTLACLQSLSKLDLPNVEIIVLDNGSTDGSIEAIRHTYPNYTLIDNHTNLGYAEGNNVGIRYAYNKGAEYVLILNNDIIVDPNCIYELLSFAKKTPKGGIFGATVYKYGTPDEIVHLGGVWDGNKAEFQTVATPSQEPISVDYVCGCSILLTRAVIDKVGYFEAKFFLLWEEADLCARALRENFTIWTVPKAKVWHKISASFTEGKPQMHYFWWRNRLLWIERNIEKKEQKRLYKKIIFPQMYKIFKLQILKKLQLIFTLNSRKRKKRREKYLRYKAGCRGIRDYYLKRFGNRYKKV